MTRLPWQHGRSRTKSGSDKSGFGSPHDWFSRTTSEPSRQALTELVKQHKREQSDGSNGTSPRSRLRSDTAASHERARSSRGRSDSDDVGNNSWYPIAGQDDAASFTTDRMEGPAKALLSKGSYMLRRRGSKLSLSSNGSASTLGFTSPSRTHSVNVPASRRTSRDDMRNKISAPFDFQHVTHTEQTQFPGLGRIDESELAHRFSTIATGKRSFDGLKGVEASQIRSLGLLHDDSTSTDTRSILSPARPKPPPKDGLDEHIVSTEVLLPPTLHSPLRLSPISMSFPQHDLVPARATAEEQQILQNPVAMRRAIFPEGNPLASKPLPQLPVIHAVTTEDDSARAMIMAPLPTPPGSTSPTSEIDPFTNAMAHHRQKSSVVLPRHYTLYPSSKSSMPNLLSADRAVSTVNTLSRHHSDMALSRQVKELQTPISTRTSMSFAAVDTMDWEAAVDEAWDADVEAEEWQDVQASYTKPKRNSPFISGQFVEQPSSNVSTPLMMAHCPRPNHTGPEKHSPPLSSDFHKLDSVQEDESLMPFSGLGISSFSGASVGGGSTRDSTGSHDHSRRSQSSTSSGKYHHLTRSSSQESVINSIASSLIETQRSSKSSVLTHDLGRKIEDLDIVAEASGEDSDLTKMPTRIRPESGCLPPDLLDQYSLLLVTGKEALLSAAAPQSDNNLHKSMSKIAVPERRSSILSSNQGQPSRSRSNTLGGKPRQSYSLFPAAQQPLMSATVPS